MSGFVGVVRFDESPATASDLGAMAERQPFRAPTGPVLLRDGMAGFAALPLDRSDATDPSALLEADGLVVAGDVRIDNRDELTALFPTGRRASDVELVLAAYRAWGDDCPRRLLGDYAFAIWDGSRRRLLLARDAMGMRPLYYIAEPGRILVASEIDQLLAAGGEPVLDEERLAAFLAGSMHAGGSTFYRDVSELPAGSALAASPDGHATHAFWQADAGSEIRHADEWEYAEELRSILRESVRCRMRTDAPVGILLSGGLDSMAAASTAARLIEDGDVAAPTLRPYTWFSSSLPAIDERVVSRQIAEGFSLDATEVPVDGAWPLEDYPAHGPHRDEPFVGVYQAIIESSLSAAHRDGARIMLSGDRGDLVMGGWTLDYVTMAADRRWSHLRQELRRHERATGESMASIVLRYLLQPAWRRLRARGPAAALRSLAGPGITTSEHQTPPWLAAAHSTADPRLARGDHRQRRVDWIFSGFQMRSMAWSERTYARHGLIFVDPWSDLRIAEFALTVPPQVLNRPGELDKRLVRNAMAGVIPEQARIQATKTPPTPLYHAALRGPGYAAATDLLRATRLEALGLVDRDRLLATYEQFIDSGDPQHDVWWPIAAEWWLRSYWDGERQ